MKQSSSAWIWGLVIVIIVAVLVLIFHTPSMSLTGNNPTASTSDEMMGDNTSGGQMAAGAQPTVTTAGFASVSSTTAVVVGTVIPNGLQTTYWFEYGPTMDYGSSADAVTAAPSYKQIGAAAYITGLKPNTEYYFRIAARNAYGTTYGGQYKFITKDQ